MRSITCVLSFICCSWPFGNHNYKNQGVLQGAADWYCLSGQPADGPDVKIHTMVIIHPQSSAWAFPAAARQPDQQFLRPGATASAFLCQRYTCLPLPKRAQFLFQLSPVVITINKCRLGHLCSTEAAGCVIPSLATVRK